MKRFAVSLAALQPLVGRTNIATAPMVVWAWDEQGAKEKGMGALKEICPERLGWIGHQVSAMEIPEYFIGVRPEE